MYYFNLLAKKMAAKRKCFTLSSALASGGALGHIAPERRLLTRTESPVVFDDVGGGGADGSAGSCHDAHVTAKRCNVPASGGPCDKHPVGITSEVGRLRVLPLSSTNWTLLPYMSGNSRAIKNSYQLSLVYVDYFLLHLS